MAFNGVNPSIMRLEVRTVDPYAPPKRKVSAGAKFANALGSFLGPTLSVAGVFFPPLLPAGMAAYGMKGMAGNAIAKQQAFIQAEKQMAAQQGPRQISYMGYQDHPAQMHSVSTMHPGVAPVRQDRVMDVLFLRQEASNQMIHSNYQGR